VSKPILVVGGGISGLTTAIEAAEVGYEVVLVEKQPYLGGRVARMNRYFPKLCPPQCGLEINFRRIRNNPRIQYHVLAELESVSGTAGDYRVTLRKNPGFINNRCTACGDCVKVCPAQRSSEYDYGMCSSKAVWLPGDTAMPFRHTIDPVACEGPSCAKCVAACKYDAIDLEMKPQTLSLDVGAIVAACGWEPYDAAKLDNLGFGVHQNVITNVQMERLGSPSGPTKGEFLRPSDSKAVKRVGFVQCAGSRDQNHLPYCSAVCCAASMKQALALRELDPGSQAIIFYIDVRAMARLESFYQQAQADDGISFVKGKVARITEDAATSDLLLEAEDVDSGAKSQTLVDMAVLATGIVPATASTVLPLDLDRDENGFLYPKSNGGGIFAAGGSKRPADVSTCVRDATGAALKAIQAVRS